MSGGAEVPAGGRSIADFEQWLDRAVVGDRFVYAWGAVPQRTFPVWTHAADLHRDGMVRLHHRRNRDGGWDYIAVRGDPPVVAAKARPAPPVGGDDDPAEKVLRALSRAANFSRPCPSNAELARLCGLNDAAAASYRVRQLRDLGRIVVGEQGPGLPRVVRIVSSGKVTAGGAA